jgi:hypothetical protein
MRIAGNFVAASASAPLRDLMVFARREAQMLDEPGATAVDSEDKERLDHPTKSWTESRIGLTAAALLLLDLATTRWLDSFAIHVALEGAAACLAVGFALRAWLRYSRVAPEHPEREEPKLDDRGGADHIDSQLWADVRAAMVAESALTRIARAPHEDRPRLVPSPRRLTPTPFRPAENDDPPESGSVALTTEISVPGRRAG